MALTFYNASVAAATGNGVVDGIFFPVGFVGNLEVGEISGTSDSDIRESKAVYSLLSSLLGRDLIGLSLVAGSPGANGVQNSFTQIFTATIQYVGSLVDNTFEVLKRPTKGTEMSKIVALKDISASIEKISNEDAIPGEGFLVPTSDLLPYGCPTHATLDITTGQDNRNYLAALLEYLVADILVRAANTKLSALTAKTIGDPVVFAFDANALDVDNPTTGYANLMGLKPIEVVHTFTFEFELNHQSQKYEVRVV